MLPPELGAGMRRRDVIRLLGSTAAAWTLGVRAQQPGNLPTIGFLGTGASLWDPLVVVFEQRLRELGWTKGRRVAILYRLNDRGPKRDAEIAAEFVRLKVDVIVTVGSKVRTFKQATSVIPIIFAVANDPVGGGLVASLARPGGNVTGLSLEATDLASKRLELLREIVPRHRQVAVMADVGFPQAVLEMREVQAAAGKLGMSAAPIEIRRAEDIVSAFVALKAQGVDNADARLDALYVVGDSLTNSNDARITALALDARLPTIFNNRSFVQVGGLMSYGPNFRALIRHTAELVDVILRGGKPADIPVEQPTNFELVVNLKTAKALGLAVPQSLLFRADEVIE